MRSMDSPAAKANVLFLCTANSARSQMAEGQLRHFGPEGIEAYSAGIDPGVVHPMAIRVMQEIGIDISRQRAKGVNEFLGRLPVHWVIFVCDRAQANCPKVYPFAQRSLAWPFEDPAEGDLSETEGLERFRSVRDQIAARIQTWVKTEFGTQSAQPNASSSWEE